MAVQAAKAAKLAAVFTQRAEQSVKDLLPMPPGLATGTVAQSIGVDTVDQNDTGRTAKEQCGKAMCGPGVTTQELEEVVALCGVMTKTSPEASRARYGNRGPEKLRRIFTAMKGKVVKRKAEKRKAELQGKEKEAKPANHKNVTLFGVRRAEAQRNEDEKYEASIRSDRALAAACSGKVLVPGGQAKCRWRHFD